MWLALHFILFALMCRSDELTISHSSETAAGENATAYYPILDKVANGYFNGISSEKDLYDAFLRLLSEDGYVTRPDMLSTFNFALSMRTAAPRVEAHYQYYATGIEPHLGSHTSDKDCNVWALIDGQRYCSPDLALAKDKGTTIKGLQVTNLPFDRILGAGVPAVLYADIRDPAFAPFHKAMMAAAQKGEVSYRLRHRQTASYGTPEPLPVNGYGVELSLKRTDYIVIDDRETGDQLAVKDTADDVQVVLNDDEEVADLKPLSKAELLNLGLSTTSYIMQSPNPFDTLVKVTQDFPKYSTKLAAHEIASEILEKRPKRDANTPAGRNMMWINGVQQIERQIEPFNLLEALRRERKLIQGVRSLGLNARQANALLGHNAITGSKISEDSIRYDWRDNLEGNRVIMWMNNLEKDPGYAQFDRSVKALLRQNFGQIPPIARNVFNLIVPIDFTTAADVSLAGQLWGLSQRGLPIRFGIVPLLPSNTATEIGKALYHLYHKYGFEVMLQYVSEAGVLGTLEIQKKVFDTVVSGVSKAAEGGDTPMSLADILTADSSNNQIEKARSWIKRMEASSNVPPFLVNGVMMARTERWMQSMSQRLQIDLHLIQNAIREKALTDDGEPLQFFLQNAVLRRNKYINPSEEKDPRVLDVGKLYLDHKNLFDKIATIEPLEDTTKEKWAAMTLVVDLTSDAGLQMLLNAFAFVEANDGVRLDIIHNPVETCGASRVNEALFVNDLDAQNVNQLRDLLRPDGHAIDESFDISLESFLLATNIQPGSSMVILNGRMIGPIADEDAFTKDDFQQFLLNERRVRIFPIYTAIDDLELGDIISNPLEVAKLTSIAALSTINDLPQGIFDSVPTIRANIWDKWDDSYASFEVGDAEESNVHIVVLLNPVSEQGQRWAGILKVLSELNGVYIKVFLNPSEKLTELPLKRFWRHVLASQPTFDAETGKVEKLHGLFKGLPSEALLNTKLDVPPLWLVAPKVSVYDPDNIKLSVAKGNVEAVYELQSILIEGHSRDGATTPPRGAQLVLATEKNPHQEDTIIMANIGYFQFKANPGFYSIQLLPGLSSDIFEIESVGAKGFRPVAGDKGTEVCVMSFQGKTLFPRLVRKPGMETADVLDVGDEGDSLLAKGKKLASGLGLFSSKNKGQEEQAEINIFSVASGHLYERMLSIMMVSVMKNTKHTVKFWFIEQFLSPSFKDFIPFLAEEYGFKYEMVAYKWPHWLRGQKEKQREIWGYKILFLDVLFPLSLDKVIFVDADQVVRTDMIDLVNVDLEGAPYGFTPMCDSRVEMEGFRFWKQGYWANYLRGKPYHISALYVVDLKQFRRLAAGDRLRQTYHSLSADPNSLSNLDQDLPNHMQFQLPIHSLSQDWLWCETWCSDKSLKEARTIDLCNNPETKEPKLDRARRQVPEWTQYDGEIAAVDRRRRGSATEEKGAKTEEEPEAKNTKSRSWEEPPAVVTEKDEL
ncbi:killer toxin resistant protein [Ceratocystis pirilliformis]|uniref:Killer toxin resistant protein n=1 Tax=Ceratocystis pirilliformis TaxID=259994 RepID=A0ABR3YNU2_9PEZI